ncbi:MAG: hypothetical protein RLZZ50_796 [Verrucomicrobiota bacterium]
MTQIIPASGFHLRPSAQSAVGTSRFSPLFALFSVLSSCLPPLFAASATPLTLPPLVVSATRAPQNAATLPLTVDVVSANTLRNSPSLTLDDTLRRSPAFSLFRRSGSLTANPTAQGVSLRGIGLSGASRAIVLLDGVPVNDPFGGWIAWTKLPSASLDRVEIVRGGGSAAWGGSSLGGVIHLVSAPILPTVAPTAPSLAAAPQSFVNQWLTKSVAGASAGSGMATATLGDFRTRGAEVSATLPAASGNNAFQIDASAFATDGVKLVRDPGPIDTPADLATSRGQLAWATRVSNTATLTTTARAWREDRGNGTPYQQNASEELFASATLAGTPRDSAISAWSVSTYAQDQDYRSTFSAVNAARTAETNASDQYAVPASAVGISAQATFGDAAEPADPVTTLGFDARTVEGETREFFFYDTASSDFLRERRAGGSQSVAGLFATHALPLAPDLTLTLGARMDSTWHSAGFRRETVRTTGAVLRDDAYANRDDLAFSPSAGLAWRATDAFTARACAYSAYRTPTLNELYRPFRVGPVTTLANPDLDPETLSGGELGLAYFSRDTRRGLRATVFQNDLSDAVANVTLAPDTRQRRNLDATRIRGLELGGHYSPDALPALRLEADYLHSDARVRSGGPGAAALDGKRLAQVPHHTLSAGADWQATRSLGLDLRARWFSAQYEDDLNTLSLASATRLDLAARLDLTPRLRLTLEVENLLDAEIETSRTSAGVVNVAPPRQARAELRYAW